MHSRLVSPLSVATKRVKALSSLHTHSSPTCVHMLHVFSRHTALHTTSRGPTASYGRELSDGHNGDANRTSAPVMYSPRQYEQQLESFVYDRDRIAAVRNDIKAKRAFIIVTHRLIIRNE